MLLARKRTEVSHKPIAEAAPETPASRIDSFMTFSAVTLSGVIDDSDRYASWIQSDDADDDGLDDDEGDDDKDGDFVDEEFEENFEEDFEELDKDEEEEEDDFYDDEADDDDAIKDDDEF